MAATIKVRRGLETNLPVLNEGEIGFATDSKKIYIGDGTNNHEIAMINNVMVTDDYKMIVGKLLNPMVYLPLTNGFNMPHGVGEVTFARSSIATYIDRYGVLKKVNNDEPRFEKNGLLIEGVGTNLLTHSEDLSDSVWAKNRCTISSNATDAPDGTTTADGLIGNTEDNTHISGRGISSPTTDKYSFSFFTKAGNKNYTYTMLQYRDSGGVVAQPKIFYDLDTEDSISTADLTNTTLTNLSSKKLSNGWMLCKGTVEYTGSATLTVLTLYVGAADSLTDNTFIGDNSTINIYLWGAQLELFLHSTSYIPTTSTTISRSNEICYIDYEENIPLAYKEDFSVVVDADNNGETTYQQILYRTNNDHYRGIEFSYNANQVSALFANISAHSNITDKNMARYIQTGTSDSTTIYRNGDELHTTINISPPSTTLSRNTIQLGYAGVQYLYGHIKNFRIYDFKLTSKEAKIA